ncbi:uncharacterized protein LOC117173145 [Belonocnema kinseyi]|uniref:uncharacterized protein LOC117173145 n=1 Tax=Belonocnema kinseyi TaxID=2817044 RepID=UPI00143D2613|nr:uncharacterized protein LOC117173145 [Belonocnema kinseyi]
MDYEKEMFLYPKTCFVCHESNLDLLRNCKCGVSLCKIHENDFRHQQLCKHLSLAFQLSMMESPRYLNGIMKAKPEKASPCSMEEFLDSFFQFKRKSEGLHKLILSNLHTRPLTFVYAGMKLNLIDYFMVIHVIGATGMEVATYANWMPVFFLLKRLQNLKIVFIGPKIFSESYSLDSFFHDFPSRLKMEEATLKAECHALRYEEYCRSDSFVQPNIILGYNLNLHESELGISDCTWKDTILMFEELKVPFVLTAGSEDRARKDHESLCKLLGKSVDYISLDKNPFGGFIPERDFETEELLFSNQHVIIYDGFYENFEGKNRVQNLTLSTVS